MIVSSQIFGITEVSNWPCELIKYDLIYRKTLTMHDFWHSNLINQII
jgi:hypothetical protein